MFVSRWIEQAIILCPSMGEAISKAAAFAGACLSRQTCAPAGQSHRSANGVNNVDV